MADDTKEGQEPKLTEQEIKESIAQIGEALFGVQPKTPEQLAKEKTDAEAAAKKKEEETAKQKADEEAKAAAKAAEEKAEKKAAETKPPPTETQPATVPTAGEIADEVAKRMAPQGAKTGAPELSAEDKANRDVIEFMAKEDPKKYGELLAKFDAFIPAEKAYREKWEKENPGHAYDVEDEAHAEFYKAHDPIVGLENEFSYAEVELKVLRKTEQRESEKEQKRQFEEAVKTVNTKLKTHNQEITGDLLKAVDPELGKLDLSSKKLRDEDPLAEAAVRPYVAELSAMTAELTKAFTPGLNYQFREDNPLHVQIVQAVFGYENELLKLPPEQQGINDGRKLVPIEDYNKMTPAQKAKHWSVWLEPTVVRSLMVRDAAAKAKEDLTLYRSKAGKTAHASAPNPPPKKEEPKATEQQQDKGKKEFPNTGGGAEGSTAGSATDVIGPSDAKLITDTLFAS